MCHIEDPLVVIYISMGVGVLTFIMLAIDRMALKGNMGSGVGKQWRGCPFCDPCVSFGVFLLL
jgi:hypothetical protein